MTEPGIGTTWGKAGLRVVAVAAGGRPVPALKLLGKAPDSRLTQAGTLSAGS